MAVASTPRKTRSSRAKRQDGADTRAHLLDTAGMLFAEHGYSGTSSKDVCLAANVNLAAVNYHFGSREGLYEAVLVKAHEHIMSLEMVSAFAESEHTPREKLQAVLAHLVRQGSLDKKSWGFKVLLREIMRPSPAAPSLVNQAIRPKAAVLKKLVAEVLQLPGDHPAVQRGLMLTLLPCIGLLLAPREIRRAVLPAIDAKVPDLLEDISCFAFAGLDALARAHRLP